ncbi:hypothetical protein [Corynebacterium oculi]|uniref:hypothetical protein n=1 Tax=Corynebacterium oculi TaxID=1544416 RepID=UPI001237143D|nr:hypothetical protein [Corynebacterium oculi]
MSYTHNRVTLVGYSFFREFLQEMNRDFACDPSGGLLVRAPVWTERWKGSMCVSFVELSAVVSGG